MHEAVFDHPEPQRRQFLRLTALHPPGRIHRRLVLAAAALTRSMRLDGVGAGASDSRCPGWPGCLLRCLPLFSRTLLGFCRSPSLDGGVVLFGLAWWAVGETLLEVVCLSHLRVRLLAQGRVLRSEGWPLHSAFCAQSRSHGKPALYGCGERCGRVRAVRRRHDVHASGGVEEGRRWATQRRTPRLRLVME
jgi:hypothetical protein